MLTYDFSLYDTLSGYVFPYFKIIDGWLYRCERTNNDVVCYRAKQENDKTIVEPIVGDMDKVDNVVKETFDLLNDYSQILKRATEEDEILDHAFNTLKGYKLFTSRDWSEILVSAIISQNATAIQFRRMYENFVGNLGEKISGELVVHPHPKNILENENKLGDIGIGYRSKLLIRAIKEFQESKIDEDEDTDSLLRKLVKIGGIGVYTATSLLLFHLKRYDAPLWDRFIGKKVMGELYGRPLNSFREFSEYTGKKWGNARGLALAILVAYYYKNKGKSLLEYWGLNRL